MRPMNEPIEMRSRPGGAAPPEISCGLRALKITTSPGVGS
jgi:hypothetical protein